MQAVRCFFGGRTVLDFGGQYLHNSFNAQFEPDGDGFLYRHRGSGPMVHVTADEHAEFVREYAESSKRFLRGTVITFIAILVGFTVIDSAWSLDDGWMIVALIVPWPAMMFV